MIRGKTVDEYIANTPNWAEPKLTIVRNIALDVGLTETVKWGAPVYSHKTNILGLGAFKNWVSIWFFNGVFLADDQNILLTAQDKTKGLRQWRFLPDEDVPVEKMRAYILEAMANDEKGLKIEPKRNDEPIEIPLLLKEALEAKPGLMKLFESMSPSHQREYCGYINEAKREETKQRRVEKSIGLIASNKGLNDKYKK